MLSIWIGLFAIAPLVNVILPVEILMIIMQVNACKRGGENGLFYRFSL